MAIRLHKREALIQDANIALMDALIEWRQSEAAQKLTEWELVSLMSHELSSYISGVAKYAIRLERHGGRDKPGGAE